MLPKRKQHRLPAEEYARIGSSWSLVLAVKRRQRVFADPDFATQALQTLVALAESKKTPLHTACIMPDHVHIVVSPSLQCSVLTFVARFKQLTWRYAWQRGRRQTYWQRGFWDRGVRSHWQLDRENIYVMQNPVRAGLATTVLDYPYSFAPWLKEARRRRGASVHARAGQSTRPYK